MLDLPKRSINGLKMFEVGNRILNFSDNCYFNKAGSIIPIPKK